MADGYTSGQNHKCQESLLLRGLQRISSCSQRLSCFLLHKFGPTYSSPGISSLPQLVLLYFLYLFTYGLCFSGLLTPLQNHCSGNGVLSPPVSLSS